MCTLYISYCRAWAWGLMGAHSSSMGRAPALRALLAPLEGPILGPHAP